MMRRLICFLLVLVLGVSLACPVLAATNSPSNTPPAGGSGTPSTDNPKTGDQIMMHVIIMVLALLALVAVAVLSRKVFAK